MTKNEQINTKSELADRMRVNRGTLYSWIRKGIIPESGPWDLNDCLARLEAYRDEQAEESAPDDLRTEKLSLECQKLRVVIQREKEALTQSQIETARIRGELVDRKEIMGEFRAVLDEIRRTVESWAQHETAKHPETAATVEGLRDSLFRAIAQRAKEDAE